MDEVLVNCVLKLAKEKVWLGELDRPAMTVADDLGRKATKQTNKNLPIMLMRAPGSIHV